MPADPAQRVTNAFYGRMAVRVDFLCEIGDLVPGQSGEALSRDFFGFVPPGFVSRPSNRRLPFIAVRYPPMLLRAASDMHRLRADTDAWWRRDIAYAADLSLSEAQRRTGEAMDRFAYALGQQAVMAAGAIQPVFEQLTTLATAAGVDASVLLRGHGSHEESVVLRDVWELSRDRLALDDFLARHGYHGPSEGELSATPWRADPTPVRRLVTQYRRKDDSEAPDAAAGHHGMMSHAAVVARELGLPCVMNTATGTRSLRTGDTVRVDGAAGTVEILARSGSPWPAST